ncbi:LacI family DNA-binding transcriptional regulator [Leifsonia sp. AG29]|uniref:LacI family DNA-binding transcriptional regulator n=1 Tax=Leifsonia sp. AG29 TaxID=2598860 RepID=UPI00131B45CC|nr:LacI family DNA-binding transcriptional regulator [Leifsonia sp. AG29]
MIDVAKLAGVSHQTVSRYFRDEGTGMKPATVERIHQAVKELGYRPNLIARSMRTRRSNRIALILPRIGEFVPTPVLRGAFAAAGERGFFVDIVSLAGDERADRARVATLVANERVEGVLSLTSLTGLDDDGVLSQRSRIVVAEEYDENMRSRGAFADGDPALEIVRMLADMGHRRFLHIAGPMEWTSAKNRRDAYLEAIARSGVTSYDVVPGDWSVRSGYQAVHGLPATAGVTAILAANDCVAFGAIRALQERGIRVPEDVSVFGWDDEQFGAYTDPTLSTVAVDKEGQGRRLMQILLARIHGENEPDEGLDTIARIVVRGSSGPAPI